MPSPAIGKAFLATPFSTPPIALPIGDLANLADGAHGALDEAAEELLELLLVVDGKEFVGELDFLLLAQFLLHHPQLEFLELEFLATGTGLPHGCIRAACDRCHAWWSPRVGFQTNVRRTARRDRKPG